MKTLLIAFFLAAGLVARAQSVGGAVTAGSVSGGGGGGSASPTPVSITYAATITPVANSSPSLYRCILTGAVTVNPPAGGADGNVVILWLTASGGARNISFAGAIVVPTSSSFTSPYSLTSGKKAKILLQYDATLNGGQWELTSFVPGF